MAADCGITFPHDRHLYKTEREKVKACDGDPTKRQREKERENA